MAREIRTVAIIDDVEVKLNKEQIAVQDELKKLIDELAELEYTDARAEAISKMHPYKQRIKSIIDKVVATHPTTITPMEVLNNIKQNVIYFLGYGHLAYEYLMIPVVEYDLVGGI